MKVAGLAVVLFGVAVAGSAIADPFEEFRIPAHHGTSWTADVSGSADRRLGNSPSGDDRDRALFGAGQSSYSWFYDSDPAALALGVSVLARGNRRVDESRRFFPAFTTDQVLRDRWAEEQWTVSALQRRYPWAAPWGWEVSGLARGGYFQTWSILHSENRAAGGGTDVSLNAQNFELWSYRTDVSASAAFGFGRIRDVTRVYDARVIEQRLLDTGALARPLSAAARQRLSALLYVEPRYDAIRERPLKYLWREIERIAREDGALSDHGLDPFSVLRAGETSAPTRSPVAGTAPSPILRRRGGFAGLEASAAHADLIERRDIGSSSIATTGGTTTTTTFNSSSRYHASLDGVLVGGRAEWHAPWSLGWQLDLAGRVVTLAEEFGDGLQAEANGGVTGIVADRWTATVSADWFRAYGDIRSNGPRDDRWVVVYGGSLAWYVEDRTELRLQVSEQQFHARGPATFGPAFERFDREARVSLGLSYRLLGTFAAPGVIEPVRIGAP